VARDDRKLLKRIAAGDDRAFSAFYRSHLNAIVAFFRRRSRPPNGSSRRWIAPSVRSRGCS
jgi:hypothetical protein